MVWANLIVATGHNNLAISRGVEQVAKRLVDGRKLRPAGSGGFGAWTNRPKAEAPATRSGQDV